jgi:hypothetical protein
MQLAYFLRTGFKIKIGRAIAKAGIATSNKIVFKQKKKGLDETDEVQIRHQHIYFHC